MRLVLYPYEPVIFQNDERKQVHIPEFKKKAEASMMDEGNTTNKELVPASSDYTASRRFSVLKRILSEAKKKLYYSGSPIGEIPTKDLR